MTWTTYPFNHGRAMDITRIQGIPTDRQKARGGISGPKTSQVWREPDNHRWDPIRLQEGGRALPASPTSFQSQGDWASDPSISIRTTRRNCLQMRLPIRRFFAQNFCHRGRKRDENPRI